MQRPAADAEEEMRGHFLDRTEHHEIGDARKLLIKNCPISVPTASIIVYGSAILGWVVIAAFGVAGFF
jgi:hypothetical protein